MSSLNVFNQGRNWTTVRCITTVYPVPMHRLVLHETVQRDGNVKLATWSFYSIDTHAARIARIRTNYGFSKEEAERIYEDRKTAKCEICGRGESARLYHGGAYIDHDHRTGKFRGFLCQNCNFHLGWVESNPQSLDYLAKHNSEVILSRRL